jgi:aspartate/methionine/tyrosine aminotransferase
MAGIAPFHVMALLAEAQRLEAEGRDIVRMEVGEPDFATPEPIARAGVAAIESGLTHYTPAAGLPELRARIARYYAERYGVEIAPERVLVTPGASGALLLAFGVLLDAGDQVLMADPGYPCNRQFARVLGAEPVGVAVGAETAYQLNAALLARRWTGRTRAALLASPANPTGTLIPARELAAMAELVRAQGGHLVVDEIYHGLTYGLDAPTALAADPEVFVVNSFSKYFGMTGWRLGWVIAPEDYVREMERLAQNLFLAPPTPAQHAALAAFEPETLGILEQRRAAFRERRDFLLPELRDLGFEIAVEPQGAFYIYADCSAHGRDAQALCARLLDEAGVAVTPGIDFGAHRANEHVRFAYTTSVDRLRVAVGRLRELLG